MNNAPQRWRLKKGYGRYVTNISGRYYRLDEIKFREYPPEILQMYEGQLEPETVEEPLKPAEPKSTNKSKQKEG